jgi:tetratricopeptide (TPR) repeat protein
MTEYVAGTAMVQKGDFGEARNRAENIKQLVEHEGYDTFYLDFYYMLLAEMHLARGEVDAATSAKDRVSYVPVRSNPRYQILLADIQARTGDISGAMDTQQRFYSYHIYTSRPWYGGDPFDYFLACSRVNYRLGKLYEQQGDESRAVEYYEKALEQWKNADEDFPELLDAKARLARLDQSSSR